MLYLIQALKSPYCARLALLLEFPGLLKLDLPTIALEMDPECNEAMDTP